jgi:hypothetical protein
MENRLIQKNSYIFGILLALIIPIVFAAILFPLNVKFLESKYLSPEKILLLGVAINLILMRFYFVKQKLDLTAKALLGTVFVEIMLIFIFKTKILLFFSSLL